MSLALDEINNTMNIKLIEFLHSVYPELPIDVSYMRGYSDDEIKKIERLYDIEVKDQLYDFFTSIGVVVVVFLAMILFFFIEIKKQ